MVISRKAVIAVSRLLGIPDGELIARRNPRSAGDRGEKPRTASRAAVSGRPGASLSNFGTLPKLLSQSPIVFCATPAARRSALREPARCECQDNRLRLLSCAARQSDSEKRWILVRRISTDLDTQLQQPIGAQSCPNIRRPVVAPRTLRCPAAPCGRADLERPVGATVLRRSIRIDRAFCPDGNLLNSPVPGSNMLPVVE